MVYAGTVQRREVTLGVSGRLMGEGRMRNLVMWDPETKSLWSQIRGEALSGPLKGARLAMLPRGLRRSRTWKRMHPETVVLDLSPVRARSWYFTSEDLARGSVTEKRRGQESTHALGLGLRRARSPPSSASSASRSAVPR